MSTSEDLQIKSELFSSSGVIGRMDYFINSLKVFGLAILAYLPVLFGVALMGEIGSVVGGLITFVAFLPVIYFSYINMFKRLRDIRGTTESQFGYQTGLVVAMCIPFVNLGANIILLFMQGKITSGNTNGPSNKRSDSAPDSQQVDNLVKLHQLKQTGALTQEEYDKIKADTIKKVA
jgi:uncharacterized membrane protein YhaH (DUF805 family)